MKKLRLDVEALEVETFRPEATSDARGTVAGHESIDRLECWSFIGTWCSVTVWEAGCSFETAPLDCGPTQPPYGMCGSEMYATCGWEQ